MGAQNFNSAPKFRKKMFFLAANIAFLIFENLGQQ